MNLKMILLLLTFYPMTLLCNPSSSTNMVDSVTEKQKEMILNQKAEKLMELATELGQSQENSRSFYEREFFNNFPDSFREFVDLYGYDTLVRKPRAKAPFSYGPLYEESYEHVYSLFGKLSTIPTDEYYSRLFNICIGGYWEADGVNFLRSVLREKVEANTMLTCELLSKRNDDEIISFWRFYFAGPAPKKSISECLPKVEGIKDINHHIYSLMQKAIQDVRNRWGKGR